MKNKLKFNEELRSGQFSVLADATSASNRQIQIPKKKYGTKGLTTQDYKASQGLLLMDRIILSLGQVMSALASPIQTTILYQQESFGFNVHQPLYSEEL
ncbi:hypothetical protein TNCV_3824341 [Trichonephila clavipes]|nr:hypothetical protein TNCV_3824341 [Trichonephila clavipes]